jgi:hypothetical protein
MPRDPNQLAKMVVDMTLHEDAPEPKPEHVKDPAAVELGRRGGLIGGRKRAENLTPQKRTEIARKAAQARWGPPAQD